MKARVLLKKKSVQKQATVREASNIINIAIQNEIGNMKSSDMDLTTFNLRTCVANTNPILCLCTRSVREWNGKENDHDAHVKTIRRFFRVCMMLFTTNASYNTTLHHLIAEAMKVNGGSRVLNRLGVCISADTYERLVTTVADFKCVE